MDPVEPTQNLDLPPPDSNISPTQPVSEPDRSVSRQITLICIGIFVTTFACELRIARLPLRSIIKNQFHLGPEAMAAFFAIVGLAWYLKPIAGIIVDSLPLFGTRRKHYIILAGLAGGISWLTLAVFPATYKTLLYTILVADIFTVLGSTVIGGLLVDFGIRSASIGRLSSYRLAIMNITVLASFLAGGYLASKPFGITAIICAGSLMLMGIAAVKLLPDDRSEPTPKKSASMITVIKQVFVSGSMWSIAGLTFLFYLAPGFQSLLYYYQQNRLHMSDAVIGQVFAVNAGAAILGGLAYALVCRHWNLRSLLFVGIFINAAASLFYLFYYSPMAAYFIEGLNGFISTLGLIPLYDASARATPKGCEAVGYSLIMAVGNFAIALSDILGAKIASQYHLEFTSMVWLNFATTAAVLIFVPFLPRRIFALREGVKTEC